VKKVKAGPGGKKVHALKGKGRLHNLVEANRVGERGKSAAAAATLIYKRKIEKPKREEMTDALFSQSKVVGVWLNGAEGHGEKERGGRKKRRRNAPRTCKKTTEKSKGVEGGPGRAFGVMRVARVPRGEAQVAKAR